MKTLYTVLLTLIIVSWILGLTDHHNALYMTSYHFFLILTFFIHAVHKKDVISIFFTVLLLILFTVVIYLSSKTTTDSLISTITYPFTLIGKVF